MTGNTNDGFDSFCDACEADGLRLAARRCAAILRPADASGVRGKIKPLRWLRAFDIVTMNVAK
jgi:hypothetical protein